MSQRLWAGLVVLICIGVGQELAAAPFNGTWSADRLFIVTGDETSRPIGHLAMCEATPQDCLSNDEVVFEVSLTDARLEELRAINGRFNESIRPETDLVLYKTVEFWTVPDEAGDCEDYVLAKRKALVNSGWPPSALLITVVKQKSGVGHAVLTVRTDKGDLVLDNLDADIHAWQETPYTYLKRQSQDDAGSWVTIADDRSLETVASTEEAPASPM